MKPTDQGSGNHAKCGSITAGARPKLGFGVSRGRTMPHTVLASFPLYILLLPMKLQTL